MSKGRMRLILWVIALVFMLIVGIWEVSKLSTQEDVVIPPEIDESSDQIEELEEPMDEQIEDLDEMAVVSLLVPNFIADHISSGQVAGRLSIPAINFSMPVIADATATNLNRAPSLMKSSHMPGTPGNAVISAHRMYEYGSHFNRIDELEIGDIIHYEADGDDFRFVVEQIMFVDPSEIWITLGDQREKRLTLFACTPIRIATHRLAVFAVLEESDQ